MRITIRESATVVPAKETPVTKIWLCNFDIVTPPVHIYCVFYYRPNGATNFFDMKVMMDALSRALVPYYPMAGRLNKDKDGRVEIDCQGQGALFVNAESDGVLDDLGDFAPTLDTQKLVPVVDYSLGIASYPLVVVQVTYFKCGGVSVGVGTHHYVADGIAVSHFIKLWCEMANGVDLITMAPLIDRTIFRARDPPQPVFEHGELKPTPINPSIVGPGNEPVVSIFKISREQLNMLKTKSKEDGNTIDYTSFELLVTHIWICMCKARGLPDDQETKIHMAVDGRVRHQPTLPSTYLGNVVMSATPSALAGEIRSNPTWFATRKIHNAIVASNNDYLKSLMDYYEIQLDHLGQAGGIYECCKYSNLAITSWVGLSMYEMNFGWGIPIFAGPGGMALEGFVFVLPSPIKDGSLSILITLQAEHMKLFSKFLYEVFNRNPSLQSNL